MTIEEALKWAEDPSGDFISDMDEQCIRTLAAEVLQLRIERDETKKNHGYSCHVCGALRTECEIMKRTADDTRIEVATRCIEIAHQSGATDTVSRKKIAEMIKDEFLSD